MNYVALRLGRRNCPNDPCKRPLGPVIHLEERSSYNDSQFHPRDVQFSWTLLLQEGTLWHCSREQPLLQPLIVEVEYTAGPAELISSCGFTTHHITH